MFWEVKMQQVQHRWDMFKAKNMTDVFRGWNTKSKLLLMYMHLKMQQGRYDWVI